ncbi:hypothetical protein RJ640_017546 [Escallonia rubra]|uniref:Uncharacterized protein n=1 Tax=Escallonia rubra TaxID=112253 RepID=A0AA88QYR1_9ASTE|nr:hypothetical protein RJ640_017546 [Escallonia rubra]
MQQLPLSVAFFTSDKKLLEHVTYAYNPPCHMVFVTGTILVEYIMDGLFSMKSDVYSFGVLVLEIVSGHAWKLWTEGNPLELLQQVKEEDQLPLSEVLKCLQVGLLCVQRRPEDRPTMASVLLMLDGESLMLPQPKQPGFYSEGILDEAQYPLARRLISTSNEATISLLEGR